MRSPGLRVRTVSGQRVSRGSSGRRSACRGRAADLKRQPVPSSVPGRPLRPEAASRAPQRHEGARSARSRPRPGAGARRLKVAEPPRATASSTRAERRVVHRRALLGEQACEHAAPQRRLQRAHAHRVQAPTPAARAVPGRRRQLVQQRLVLGGQPREGGQPLRHREARRPSERRQHVLADAGAEQARIGVHRIRHEADALLLAGRPRSARACAPAAGGRAEPRLGWMPAAPRAPSPARAASAASPPDQSPCARWPPRPAPAPRASPPAPRTGPRALAPPRPRRAAGAAAARGTAAHGARPAARPLAPPRPPRAAARGPAWPPPPRAAARSRTSAVPTAARWSPPRPTRRAAPSVPPARSAGRPPRVST